MPNVRKWCGIARSKNTTPGMGGIPFMEKVMSCFLNSKNNTMIQFEGCEETDCRPMKILYDSEEGWFDAHTGDKSVLSLDEFVKLQKIIMKDLAAIDAASDGEADGAKLLRIALLSGGSLVQRYHNDDRIRGALPETNGNTRRDGSLLYALTDKMVNFHVLVYGDSHNAQDGYITFGMALCKDEHVWLDDWVAHAGGENETTAVRLHVDVGLGDNKREKEVYLLKISDLHELNQRQELNPAEGFKTLDEFLSAKQSSSEATAWAQRQPVKFSSLFSDRSDIIDSRAQGACVAAVNRKMLGVAKVVSSLDAEVTEALKREAKKLFKSNNKKLYHPLNHKEAFKWNESVYKAARKDLAIVFGDVNAKKYEIIGYGLQSHQGTQSQGRGCSEPYHRLTEESVNTTDSSRALQPGSLIYSVLVPENQHKCTDIALDVVAFGDGGSGFVATSMPVLQCEALWIDDSVPRCINKVDLGSVQLLIHVGLCHTGSQKVISVVPKEELMSCFLKQQEDLGKQEKEKK